MLAFLRWEGRLGWRTWGSAVLFNVTSVIKVLQTKLSLQMLRAQAAHAAQYRLSTRGQTVLLITEPLFSTNRACVRSLASRGASVSQT